MKVSSLVDVLIASHLTYAVQSNGYDSRGGIFLATPPGCLKTTCLEMLSPYPDAMILPDLTIQGYKKIRPRLESGTTRSLVFLDMQKIYERADSVSMNIEGVLRALVCEGSGPLNWEDPSSRFLKSRALILGAITNDFYNQKKERWAASGHLRRFLVCLYQMKDPYAIQRAIEKWERLEISAGVNWTTESSFPVSSIPYSLTRSEARLLGKLASGQDGKDESLVLLQKIYAVLKWKYGKVKQPKKALAVMEDFGESLGQHGTELEI